MRALDLFAGPGGWDIAALALGLDVLGVERDDAACATRAAAGLATVQADVSGLDPVEFSDEHYGRLAAPLDLLIASPPCQAFSMAGNGAGRKAIDAYRREIHGMRLGQGIDRERLDEASADPRGHLTLEPLRWAMQLHPLRVALEQVETVLPLWEATADALRELGYRTWTGTLSAEQYGVPQTRRRAMLLASKLRAVERPRPTHRRFMPARVKPAQEESLFAAPEPERIVHPEDRDLLPWVSMAEALGWGMTGRPSVRAIRARRAAGARYDELVAEFGVGKSTISRIVTRKGWCHV